MTACLADVDGDHLSHGISKVFVELVRQEANKQQERRETMLSCAASGRRVLQTRTVRAQWKKTPQHEWRGKPNSICLGSKTTSEAWSETSRHFCVVVDNREGVEMRSTKAHELATGATKAQSDRESDLQAGKATGLPNSS